MAARLNPKHDETTRAKIQTSQLINRLMAHVNSKKPLLSSSQVNAAKALLAKTLPDLQSVQMNATVDGSMAVTFTTKYERKPDGV